MTTKSAVVGAFVVIAVVGAWLYVGTSPTIKALAPLESSPIVADLKLNPEKPVAGEPTTLHLSFMENGKPASLMTHHGRRVHIVIVGNDFATIGHIHPQDFTTDLSAQVESGAYTAMYTFPAAGKYLVAVDVMSDDSTLAQQYIMKVGGTPKMGARIEDPSLTKCFRGYEQEATDTYTKPFVVSEMELPCPEGYKVTLEPASSPLTAGEEELLRFHVEKDGKPVTDLAPYLDAEIHMAIIPESLDTLLHRHGTVDKTLGGATEMMGHDDDHEETSHAEEHTEMDTTGIHIMPDGSVMLGNGKTVSDAAVTSDGMIRMPDGSMVKPVMDMRSSSSGSMEGMHHHGHAAPASFGPDLISEPIVFPKAGTYRVFAQLKHGTEIITADFIVNVERASASSGETKVFELTVKGGKVISGGSTIMVDQGDVVTIDVTSDVDEDLHLHGYDKTVELKAGQRTELTFSASASGRFPFELEKSKADLGAVQVMPR